MICFTHSELIYIIVAILIGQFINGFLKEMFRDYFRNRKIKKIFTRLGGYTHQDTGKEDE